MKLLLVQVVQDHLLVLLQILTFNMANLVYPLLLVASLVQHQVVEAVLQMLHIMLLDLVVLVVVEVMVLLEAMEMEIQDTLVEQM
tara:strand:+ start:45 stop:299 length:255 start_codon:yes stop_codon:yes gene_type:complete